MENNLEKIIGSPIVVKIKNSLLGASPILSVSVLMKNNTQMMALIILPTIVLPFFSQHLNSTTAQLSK